MDIFSGLTSILSGGITGIIGTVVSSVYSYKSKQLDVELQKEKYKNEITMQQAEWSARTQINKTTADAQVETEDAKALAVSLSSEPKRYSESGMTTKQNWLMVGLDFFRGFIRPALTTYLAILTTIIYIQAHTLMGGTMESDAATALVNKIVDTVLYLTTTAVLWYYGSRATKVR